LRNLRMRTGDNRSLFEIALLAVLVVLGCARDERDIQALALEQPAEVSRETAPPERNGIAERAFAALRAGDVATVGRLLEAHPQLIHATDLVLGGERATLWGNPSLLHLAIQDKHYGLAERLIEAGANVTRRDDQGLTPLYYAAVPGGEDLVKRLLAAGADPNAGHPTYGTPLHKAMEHADCEELVDILLEHGADPAAENEAGVTPLSMAGSDVALTKRLLQAGVSLRALDQRLIAVGLDICRLKSLLRSPHWEADDYAGFERRLANCRAIADALERRRPDEKPSPWWRVCTQRGACRMRRELPLPPSAIHPLHVAVRETETQSYLVCIKHHNTTGLATAYCVSVFDENMRLVRTGSFQAWHDAEPFALVEIRVSSNELPPGLRNRWLLAVLTVDPFGTFDRRLPVAVSARGRSEHAGANVLGAEIVDWDDGPRHGLGTGSGYYAEGEMEVRWAEPGPSLLAGH